jgi:uncharacterized protein (DUF849 family)
MLLQAALNGSLTKNDHSASPLTIDELARDASTGVAAGTRAIHLHPRDHEDHKRFDAEIINEVVINVRNACGVLVGITTGAWIEPNLQRRIELIPAWHAPDFASTNLTVPGSITTMETLLQIGIGCQRAERTPWIIAFCYTPIVIGKFLH